MLKITRDPNGEAVFKLSGRLGADNIPELEALFSAEGSDRPIVLDLKDLLLVDQDAVSSLSAAKRKASSSTIAQHTSESGSRENGDDQKKQNGDRVLRKPFDARKAKSWLFLT